MPATAASDAQFRLELLEDDLRLAPEQRSAWLAYRERVLRLAEDSKRTARTALGGEMTAPKRLDQLADIARDRLTAIEAVDAARPYAILMPAQQWLRIAVAVPVMALAGVEPWGARGGSRGSGEPAKNP